MNVCVLVVLVVDIAEAVRELSDAVVVAIMNPRNTRLQHTLGVCSGGVQHLALSRHSPARARRRLGRRPEGRKR